MKSESLKRYVSCRHGVLARFVRGDVAGDRLRVVDVIVDTAVAAYTNHIGNIVGVRDYNRKNPKGANRACHPATLFSDHIGVLVGQLFSYPCTSNSLAGMARPVASQIFCQTGRW